MEITEACERNRLGSLLRRGEKGYQQLLVGGSCTVITTLTAIYDFLRFLRGFFNVDVCCFLCSLLLDIEQAVFVYHITNYWNLGI